MYNTYIYQINKKLIKYILYINNLELCRIVLFVLQLFYLLFCHCLHSIHEKGLIFSINLLSVIMYNVFTLPGVPTTHTVAFEKRQQVDTPGWQKSTLVVVLHHAYSTCMCTLNTSLFSILLPTGSLSHFP